GPVFDLQYATKFIDKLDANPTKIMKDYSRNCGWLSSNLFQAIGRLILAGHGLTRFAGYTARIVELFDMLDDVNNSRYKRTIVNKDANEANISKVVSQNDLDGKLVVHNGIIIFEKVLIVTSSQD
ncbi:12657_t:CDS:2, partial [Dentiscutata erythropus]